MTHSRILIADDDELMRGLLKHWLEEESWTVEGAADGDKALELLQAFRFDVAALDLYMPGKNGIEVIQVATDYGIDTSFILFTAYAAREGTLEKAFEAGKHGTVAFIEKPFLQDQFIAAIQRAAEGRRTDSLSPTDRIDAYLTKSFSNPSLSLRDVANELGVSPRYISRIFSQLGNTTFRSRLAYHRVQNAKRLLETTDDPIKVIAEESGFRNRARLYEAFQRIEKVSVTDYRRVCSDNRT